MLDEKLTPKEIGSTNELFSVEEHEINDPQDVEVSNG